jgi:hypothetical protein
VSVIPESAHALFALDPNDFVTARDQRARELRKEGEKDEAAAVKALRRPTVPVWALNQVARQRPEVVEALVAAEAAAHAAKDKDVRAALAQRRERLQDVVRAARDIIDGSGRSADPHELDLTSAVSTILTSDELTGDFREGVLTKTVDENADIEWPDVTGTPPPREPAPERPSRALVRARDEVARRQVAVDDAAQRVAAAERTLADARDALAHAEAEVARLET